MIESTRARRVWPSFVGGFAWMVIGTAMVASVAAADPKTIDLPAEFTDFALNPQTGDIAAIDAEHGTAVLFAEKTLSQNSPEAAATVKIGPTPVSICFKRFGDKSHFAVVCSQDSQLTMLNAADLSQAAKIQTDAAGTSLVFCSQNPDDPFIYLAYGSGHDSKCGAIDLRDMKNVGIVFGDTMDGAVSASGHIAYRRGPWSPSGFTSLRLTNTFADKKPEFQTAFSEHRGAAAYVPDSLDSYTANGTSLYAADLGKSIASFNFTVVGFATSPPMIFGVPSTGGLPRPGEASSKGLMVHAASYNTFQPTGEPVALPPQFAATSKPLPRGVGGQADFKRVTSRTRYLPDDKRQQLVCCKLNQLVLIPYATFNAPAEPLLNVSMKSPSATVIGVVNELVFEIADKSAKLEFTGLPDGAKATGSVVKWTPKPEQMGAHRIEAKLTAGKFERTQVFGITASNDSLTLPMEVQYIVLSASGHRALCWGQSPNRGPASLQFVTIDIANRKILTSKSELPRTTAPVIDDKYAYLFESGGSFVQVYDLATLQRVKTLNTEEAIERLAIHRGETLLASGRSSTTAFNIADFSRRRSPFGGLISLGPIGPYTNQAVLDDKLETPQLLLRLPVVISAGQSPQELALSRSANALGEPRQFQTDQRGSRQPALSNTAYRAEIGVTQPSAGQAFDRVNLLLQDWVRGAEVMRIPVTQRQERNVRNPWASVTTTSQLAVVLADGKLYFFPMPKPMPAEFTTGITLTAAHTHLTLSAANDNVLKLPHTAKGGGEKKEFMLTSTPVGVSIDEKSGEVSIQVDDAKALGVDALARQFSSSNPESAAAFVKYQQQANEVFSRLVGRNPVGVPVSISVNLRVQDENSQMSELHYVVLAEVPVEAVTARLQKNAAAALTIKPKDLVPAARTPAESGTTPANETDEVKKLRDKVELLETRIDLLTRQMGDLLKRLDEQKSDKK